MKVSRTTWLLAASAISVWGASFIFNKIALKEMGPTNLAFYDWLFASGFLLIYGAAKGQIGTAIRALRRRPLVFLALAICFITIPYVLQNLALQHASVVNVSLLVSADPLFAVMLSAMFLGEWVSGTRWGGVMLAFLGTALVTMNGGVVGLGSDQVVGSLFALAAAFFWGIHTVLAKVVVSKDSPLTTTILTAVLGTTLLFPITLYEGIVSPMQWSPAACAGVLFLGIACSGCGSLAWLHVLAKMDASRAAPLVFGLPVVAWTLSIILLHERPTLHTALGAMLVLGGVFISEHLTQNERAGEPVPESANVA